MPDHNPRGHDRTKTADGAHGLAAGAGSGDHRPAELLLERRWRRVERIEDTWSFDIWWMPVPLDRTCQRVLREDGGEVTLFLDRRRDRWYRQAS